MTFRLSVDRVEDSIAAVLFDADGREIILPLGCLPLGIKEGDVLAFVVEIDRAETERVARETRQVQDEFKRRDLGGDIAL